MKSEIFIMILSAKINSKKLTESIKYDYAI